MKFLLKLSLLTAAGAFYALMKYLILGVLMAAGAYILGLILSIIFK